MIVQCLNLPTCHSLALITPESKAQFQPDLTEGQDSERSYFLQGS